IRRRWPTSSSGLPEWTLSEPIPGSAGSCVSSWGCPRLKATTWKITRPYLRRGRGMRSAGRSQGGRTMKHDHLPFEELLKLEDGINRLAFEFLAKQALRPEPAWYADLLEEHQAEIAAVVLLWFMEVQDALSVVDWVEWADPFLWIALEERLAR